MTLQPNPGGDNLRVSDQEREQLVALLGQAAGEGRLTLDEYSERASAAYAAKTRGELAQLTNDLPVATGPGDGPRPVQPALQPPTGPPRPLFGGQLTGTGRPEQLVAIFGNESRTGGWLVPATLEVRTIFGECRIELQNAQIQHQVTTIDVTSFFGSVTVYAPEGVDVRLSGVLVFGAKESKLRTPVRPGAPVIDIRVRGAFSSVTVRPPKRRWW